MLALLTAGCGGGGSSSGGGSATINASSGTGLQSNNPNVIVQISRTFYHISGNTIDELRRELANKGPGPYFGEATSAISYEYSAHGNCVVSGANTKVIGQLLLPAWDMLPGTSSSLVNEWNRFLAALENHELNHIRIDISESETLLADIFRISGFNSCAELDNAISSLHGQAIQRATERNRTYDESTGHGAAEGAVL